MCLEGGPSPEMVHGLVDAEMVGEEFDYGAGEEAGSPHDDITEARDGHEALVRQNGLHDSLDNDLGGEDGQQVRGLGLDSVEHSRVDVERANDRRMDATLLKRDFLLPYGNQAKCFLFCFPFSAISLPSEN